MSLVLTLACKRSWATPEVCRFACKNRTGFFLEGFTCTLLRVLGLKKFSSKLNPGSFGSPDCGRQH